MENSGRRVKYSDKEWCMPIYRSEDDRKVVRLGLDPQWKKILLRVDAWSGD
jgi:hypothetical protein